MVKNLISSIFVVFLLSNYSALAANSSFDVWLNEFKTKAINKGISKTVVNDLMSNAIFLPKVIEYDRYQPEFYEDTYTYIKKRTNKKKIRQGLALYKKEKNLIDSVEKAVFFTSRVGLLVSAGAYFTMSVDPAGLTESLREFITPIGKIGLSIERILLVSVALVP